MFKKTADLAEVGSPNNDLIRKNRKEEETNSISVSWVGQCHCLSICTCQEMPYVEATNPGDHLT